MNVAGSALEQRAHQLGDVILASQPGSEDLTRAKPRGRAAGSGRRLETQAPARRLANSCVAAP